MKKIALTLLLLTVASLGITGQETPVKVKPLKFYFTERTRIETFDNSINLDDTAADAWSYTRHYTTFGLIWTPKANLEIKLGLANEFRSWLSPKNRSNGISELFVDQLYFKWKAIADTGLSLTVGRQNLIFGEGFVCLDGSPVDGSRSSYFNAIRADYAFNQNHNLTLFVSHVPNTDNWLPILNELDPAQVLEEQANTGIGLYYQGTIRKIGLQAYYFRKDTEANAANPVESGTNTLGVQIKIPLLNQLSLTSEAALQNGTAGQADRKAFGGHFHLDYSLNKNMPCLRSITLGGIYLSGDDPQTEDLEAWDPIWSRWPKWSESYIYTLIRENRVAYWTNLSAIFLGVKAEFGSAVNATSNLYFLNAPQDGTATTSFAAIMGEGRHRGELLVSRLNYTINAHLSGHFVWEHFWPGSFYKELVDPYNWFRFELLLKY